MTFMDSVINKIIDLEWELFQQVKGQGGQAACQQDRRTFEVMRRGQALSWSVDALESYLDDLGHAMAAGRNLITEKYARMMASTAPVEYEALAPTLPLLAPEVLTLVDEIVTTVLEWELSLEKTFPNILKRGRPLLSSADQPQVTSLETYLRGELATYSLKTLKLLHAHMRQQADTGINGARITLEYTVSRSGYTCLEEAEEALAAAAGRG